MISRRTKLILGWAAVAGSIAALVGFGIHNARADDSQAAVETELGGGAPTRVLLDNASVRVTLISYPAGFKRQGGMKRRLEQLIVYVDDGDFKVIPRPGARPRPAVAPGERKVGPESSITLEGTLATGHPNHPRGTIAWHPKGSLTPSIETTRAYRALYIEFKH